MTMSEPKLIISIDQSILSQASGDCLVLLREVNKTFTTAFAVAQLTATQSGDRQLLSRNVFTWVDEFQIVAWKPYDEGLLASTVCNPVEITYRQTTQFLNSVLQPAKSLGTQEWSNPPDKTFAIEKLGFRFRFRVSQRARPGGQFLPVFTSKFTPSLQGRTEIYVEDKFALFWSNVRVSSGDTISLPEDKTQLQIVTLTDGLPKHIRYGYLSPDKPGVDENPSWYPEPLPTTFLPIKTAANGIGAKL
ncbi:hypothetical protein NW756_004642 [Fusarium oxysporum]|nr:hypothetical protein NW763_011182 [Fusarium oxysporum]KAJ4065367.1 hypothetical protein NW753_003801 [Fusarium oxysporum]KAJ4095822.1 hypothetical protein NW756_004642 [Fusarium oxysporum]